MSRIPRTSRDVLVATALLLNLGALPACRQRESPEAARARARKAFLERQIVGLQDLVAKAERGEVVTADQIAISVDEDVARELLNASLPQERVIGGRLRVRIDKVEPYFRGTQSALVFQARASSDDLKNAFADLELAGGLSDLALRDGRLSAKVALGHFSVLNASVGPLAQGVVEHLVRDNLGSLAEVIPPFEIPVGLDQTIRIGGLKEGPVSAAGGQLPLKLTVSQVLQINKRLWVLIDAKAGPWEGIPVTAGEAPPRAAREGRIVKRLLIVAVVLVLLAAGGLAVYQQRTAPPPPPTEAEFAALEAERDALQERFRASVVKAGERSLARAPRAGVMIGLPTGLAKGIVEQIVTGLFGETTLTLRNLKVHKEGDVKAKLLLRKKQVGQFVLDVDIHETRGVLKPGTPELSFGNNRIGVVLPIALAEGGGRAQIRLQWDSKGLAANAVCGDVDVTREVHGSVIPENYRVTGAFGIQTDGSSITLLPDFGEVAVRLFVDPSEDAWKVVDGVIAEQRAGCRTALEKIDIKAVLGKILGRGFNVKLPKKLFKPIRLPAGIRQSLDLQGIRLDLTVKPTGMMVSDDRLWYGADLHAKRTPPSAAPEKPPAP